MKVLHFKTKYLNISETFINRFVRNHSQFQPIIATCYKKEYTDDLLIYEMPKRGLSGLKNRLNLSLDLTPDYFYDVVEHEKPDIIHGHFALDTYRIIGLKRRYSLPIILSFYGYDVTRLPYHWKWRTRYRKLSRICDQFVVATEEMKSNVLELGFPSDKITTVKFGIKVGDIPYRKRTSAGPHIMLIGRMVEKKGMKYAIEAIHLLKQQNIEVSLSIYGNGPLRGKLETLVQEKGLQNNITFQGSKQNDEIIKSLLNHDILLIPSVEAVDGDREGLPNTAIEGLSTGIPTITTDHAGLPELIKDGETGLLVPERDSTALANAIKKLMAREQLVAKLSENGRKKVESEHDIHKQTMKLENMYQEVLKISSNASG